MASFFSVSFKASALFVKSCSYVENRVRIVANRSSCTATCFSNSRMLSVFVRPAMMLGSSPDLSLR